MDDLRKNLFYEPKNGYDRISREEHIAAEDYCRGYMDPAPSARPSSTPSSSPARRASWSIRPAWRSRPACACTAATAARP